MTQCVALSIAAQCIAHRSVLHRPSQRSAFFTTLFCRVQSCGLPEAACRACLFLPACCKAREKALGQERNRCSCGQLPQCGKTAEALALVFLFAQSTNVGWWKVVGLILPHSVHFAPIVPSGLSDKSGGPAPGADAVLSLSEACALPDLSQGNLRSGFNLCALAASTI